MPCDTNNDPSYHIAVAVSTFYVGDVVLNWLKPSDDADDNYYYGDDDYDDDDDYDEDHDDEAYDVTTEEDNSGITAPPPSIDKLLPPPSSNIIDDSAASENKTKPLFNDLLLYSGFGEPTQFGYIGYEDYGYVREFDKSNSDWVKMDELDEIKIILVGHSKLQEDEEETEGLKIEACDDANLLKISILPLSSSSTSLELTLNKKIERNSFKQEEPELIHSNCNSNSQNKQLFGEFIGSYVMASVFDFIDTNFLIKTCSKVCPEWHKMIFYNEQVVNHIFKNRTLYFFKQKDGNLNLNTISRLNEFYNMNWLETYMMSGMFVIETYWKYIEEELSHFTHLKLYEKEKFGYLVLNLDPLLHLKDSLSKDHPLISRLQDQQAKTILFSLNTLHAVTSEFNRRRCVTHFMGLESAASTTNDQDDDDEQEKAAADECLLNDHSDEECDPLPVVERMIFAKCEIPLLENKLSIDMVEGISLYDDFLKELSRKLAPFLTTAKTSSVETEWIAKCLCEMKEKAKYFLETILPKNKCTKFLVDDDILIGLHLLLLNNRYANKTYVSNIEPVNTLQLLRNRKSNDKSLLINSHQLMPPHFQFNLLEIMLAGGGSGAEKEKQHQFSTCSLQPFNTPDNALQFITEHLIELSEVYNQSSTRTLKDCIYSDIQQYLTFIKTINRKSVTPSKNVDLIFHFHMLHPNNFVQDCLRLANSIKNHKFAFPTVSTKVQ